MEPVKMCNFTFERREEFLLYHFEKSLEEQNKDLLPQNINDFSQPLNTELHLSDKYSDYRLTFTGISVAYLCPRLSDRSVLKG